MGIRITSKSVPVWTAAINAVALPIVVKFVGGNSWEYALMMAPIGGVGTYLGCRLGLWYFSRSRGA